MYDDDEKRTRRESIYAGIYVYIGNYEAICGRKFVWHASTIHGTIYASNDGFFLSFRLERRIES